MATVKNERAPAVDEIDGGARRKRRQQRSCDACRTRKVKCDRLPPTPGRPESFSEVCSQCSTFHIPCRFDHQPKKRGPPNLYVKRLAQQSESPTSPLKSIRLTDPVPDRHDGNEVPSFASTSTPANESFLHDGTDEDHKNPDFIFDFGSITDQTSSNPIESVLPREKLHHIIQLHFDYVYPLIPLIHRPTFLNDIYNRREERPGEGEFIALVFSLIACTLAQVPHLVEDTTRQGVKKLISDCYCRVQLHLIQDCAVCSLQRHAIMYFTMITAELLGQSMAARQLFGGSIALALRDGYQHESTYEGLNPIETEIRRRTWWILYTGDRSSSSIRSSPSLMIDENSVDVALPREIDDDYITESGYLEQPQSVTSILAGYCYGCKIYKITGLILQKRQADRRHPPSGVTLQMRLNEVNDLISRVTDLMSNCPPELKLDLDADVHPANAGWSFSPFNDVHQLIQDLTSGQTTIKDTYLVQKSNIYVSQQLIRLIAVQYHDELVQHQKAEFALAVSNLNLQSGQAMSQTQTQQEGEKDRIASDLLKILQSIPLRSIAVNTLPLVMKVRYVAATLLETCFQNTADNASSSQRAEAAQRRLLTYLQTLSEIESMYSLNVEPSSFTNE